MITYSPGGGLGNRLFMYVFARLLAEKNGIELGTRWSNDPARVFDGHHQQAGQPQTVTFNDPSPGQRIDGPLIVLDENTRTTTPETVLAPGPYYLQGYWQIAEWYLPHRKKIMSWITNMDNERGYARGSVAMHLRLGDYARCGPKGQILDSKYYFDCLSQEGALSERVRLFTDSLEEEHLKPFRDAGIPITCTNEKDDFWAMTHFETIICGNSTFSWWAAFLSNAARIYLPSCWMRGLANPVDLLKIQNGIVVPAGFKNA
jgi:hypothetical protein